MKHYVILTFTILLGLILLITGYNVLAGPDQPPPPPGQRQGPGGYSLEQAMSDNAQLSTIAFSGLAFITGNSGADTFFPPGKVADFFGFQYMRDVDTAGYGHNTTFLTRVASNVLYILNDSQKAKLVALAKEQAPIYANFAYNRFILMNAFRRNLEGKIPAGSTGLSSKAVSEYTAYLYTIDANLSYNRAVVVGSIINSFTLDQKAYLGKMQFNNYLSWPDVPEDEEFKRSLTHTESFAVMTYASELFSWYKGSITADVYFCPERHGTYFGGFYMKDYPAMHNPDYFISTSLTGDSGKDFLNILNSGQRGLITGIIEEQRPALKEIGQIRKSVCNELRKAMTGETIDKEKVYSLIKRYGELDGQMSALYASRFAAVNKTLTDSQRASLVKLRNLDVVPKGAYSFSAPVDMPKIPNTDFLFGAGTMPENAGQLTAPESFMKADDRKRPDNKQDNRPDNKQDNKDKPNGDLKDEKEISLYTAGTYKSFLLKSSEVTSGGTLPAEFTGDGSGATLPLEWSGAPEETKSYVLTMHHIDREGKVKWYWILYNIPSDVHSLATNVKNVGIKGNNSINGLTEYAPPHSRGPGAKTYIYTVFALSELLELKVPSEEVSLDVILSAMKNHILGTAEMKVTYTRQGEEEKQDGPDNKQPPPEQGDKEK